MSGIRDIEGGLTAPAGFRAAGVAAGIKKRPASGIVPLDFALIAADTAVPAAAGYTTNKAVAAPIVGSQEHLAQSGGRAGGIAVNAGCANACTGAGGLAGAREGAATRARPAGG